MLAELKLTLNRREQFALEKVLVDELLGLGPLEELLADPSVSDIMVNGPDQTFVERKGKLELAQIQFRDEEHLFQIAQRIVNKVGRRVDQTTPLADALIGYLNEHDRDPDQHAVRNQVGEIAWQHRDTCPNLSVIVVDVLRHPHA